MPRFNLRYTVSPMTVLVNIVGEGEDEDQQRENAIIKGRKALNSFLCPGNKQWKGANPAHSIMVEHTPIPSGRPCGILVECLEED